VALVVSFQIQTNKQQHHDETIRSHQHHPGKCETSFPASGCATGQAAQTPLRTPKGTGMFAQRGVVGELQQLTSNFQFF
jgi:hypothetical protein